MGFQIKKGETYWIGDPCYMLDDEELELHYEDMMGNVSVMYTKLKNRGTPWLYIKTYGGDVGAYVINHKSAKVNIDGDSESKLLDYRNPQELQLDYGITPPKDKFELEEYLYFTKYYGDNQRHMKDIAKAQGSFYGEWYMGNDSGCMSIVPESLVSDKSLTKRACLKLTTDSDHLNLDVLSLRVDEYDLPVSIIGCYASNRVIGVF